MEEENVKSIAEYLEALNRRKGLILISFLLVGFLGFVLAMKLPPVYRSAATILIEDQQIPRSMIESTITDFADKRIQLIKQRVMTRDRILSVIEKHKVYLDDRDKLVSSELVKRFMEDAEIETISANVLDPQRGGGKATIAFTIAFSDRSPLLAQAVANELVSLFLDENTRARAQRAAKTTEFLGAEADKLKAEIGLFETKIMDYKEKYAKSLPEMLQTNLAALDRAKESQRQTEGDIRIAKDRIVYLTDSLRQAKDEVPAAQAGKPMSKDEQIRLLKSKYIHISSLYTDKHPDAVRVKRQILNLEPSFTGESSDLDVSEELKRAERELILLQDKYADGHPDVVKQQKRVEKLKQNEKEAASQTIISELDTQQGNSLYINLNNQLRATQNELEYLLSRRVELEQNIKELQENIDRTPIVEKDYLEMLRQRQISLEKYAEIEAKHREARLAQTLEEEQKGEAFTLIEPPIAPDKPDKPNRKKIIALGLGAGLAVGFGLTILLEMLYEVIRGAKGLERVTGMPPIVVIPYIDTPQDIARRQKQKKLIWLLVLLVAVLMVLATHFFVMPLEMIWTIGLAKLGRL
ncbi:GumC family protein [Methylotuvimicrobium sp.]|uniref:GumC family protein n=1 Tax=Methylotuvimicrobium sp. TaxID=2822413 RepID=UPI003D659E04